MTQTGSQPQSNQTTSVLNNFDFTAIEDLDPSLAQGHIVMFDREAPFELRIQDPGQGPQEVGTLEAIRIKVLLRYGAGQGLIHEVKVELTSENDLFFHYTHCVDEDKFRHM